MKKLDIQITRFSENYFQVTGNRANGFVCPITLKDVAVDRLCAGHILNHALGAASSKTVLQFKDVDHYFGTTIEPDLIDFLNFSKMSVEERLKKSKRFSIKLNGESYEVFRAGPDAAKKFQRVEIIDQEGRVIDERYIKSAKIAPGPHRDVEAEFFITVHDFALTGALLKSAYLTLFKMVGYRYGLDAVGSTVRRALAEFYFQRARRVDARNYFRDFQGAVIVSLGGTLDEIPDTLEGGQLLMHYAEGTMNTGLLFASSCLFRVNSITLIVTVPAYWQFGHALDAMSYYRKLLSNREMKHSIHLSEFHGNSFEIAKAPLDIQYMADSAPPNERSER
jgi:hypothetical protein